MKLNGFIFRLPIIVLVCVAGEIKGDAAACHVGKGVEWITVSGLGEQVLSDFAADGVAQGGRLRSASHALASSHIWAKNRAAWAILSKWGNGGAMWLLLSRKIRLYMPAMSHKMAAVSHLFLGSVMRVR